MMSGLLILPGNRELCCVDSYSIGRSEFCISGIDQVRAVDTQEVVPQKVFPLAYAGFVAKAAGFGGIDLQLVSISIDGEEGWREASELHRITWTNWRDPLGNSGSVRAYNQNGIPVFVLVDPEGIIKDIQLGHYDGLLYKLTADIE